MTHESPRSHQNLLLLPLRDDHAIVSESDDEIQLHSATAKYQIGFDSTSSTDSSSDEHDNTIKSTNPKKLTQLQLAYRRNLSLKKKQRSKLARTTWSDKASIQSPPSGYCAKCSLKLSESDSDLLDTTMNLSADEHLASSARKLSSVSEQGVPTNFANIESKPDTETHQPKSWLDILILILKRSEGRDKLFKLLQYGVAFLQSLTKLVVEYVAAMKFIKRILSEIISNPLSRKFTIIIARFAIGIDQSCTKFIVAVSSARQMLRFCRFLYNLEDMRETYKEWRGKKGSMVLLDLFNSSLGCVTDACDDLEWLCESGVLSQRFGERFSKASALLWLVTICIDIPFVVSNLIEFKKAYVQKKMKCESKIDTLQIHNEYQKDVQCEQLSLLRYCCDFVVSSGLCLESTSNALPAVLTDGCGFVSGLTALYKLTNSQSLHHYWR